jgi:hypothetical protein
MPRVWSCFYSNHDYRIKISKASFERFIVVRVFLIVDPRLTGIDFKHLTMNVRPIDSEGRDPQLEISMPSRRSAVSSSRLMQLFECYCLAHHQHSSWTYLERSRSSPGCFDATHLFNAILHLCVCVCVCVCGSSTKSDKLDRDHRILDEQGLVLRISQLGLDRYSFRKQVPVIKRRDNKSTYQLCTRLPSWTKIVFK